MFYTIEYRYTERVYRYTKRVHCFIYNIYNINVLQVNDLSITIPRYIDTPILGGVRARISRRSTSVRLCPPPLSLPLEADPAPGALLPTAPLPILAAQYHGVSPPPPTPSSHGAFPASCKTCILSLFAAQYPLTVPLFAVIIDSGGNNETTTQEDV